MDGFARGGAISNRIDHQFCGIVALHRKECWVGLKPFFVPVDKILHGRGRAVHKESVDEHGSVDRRIGRAGEVRRVPSIRAKKRNFHVVEIELGCNEAGVGSAAWNKDRIEARRIENFLVQLCQFAGQFCLINRHGQAILLDVLRLHAFELLTHVGFALFVGFNGDHFPLVLAHFLGEKPGQFASIRGVGMQDAEPAESLLLHGIGRDAFGLKLKGKRRAEHIVAESSDVGQGRRRRDQGDVGSLGEFSHDRKTFREERADHGEGTIGVQQFGEVVQKRGVIGFEIFDDETDRCAFCPVFVCFDGQLNSAEDFIRKGGKFS